MMSNDYNDIFIDQLEQDLKSILPGRRAQYKMAPELRLENRHGYYQNAAVMILLFIRAGSWHTVLMKRPEYAGAHSNQISLPGGNSKTAMPIWKRQLYVRSGKRLA